MNFVERRMLETYWMVIGRYMLRLEKLGDSRKLHFNLKKSSSNLNLGFCDSPSFSRKGLSLKGHLSTLVWYICVLLFFNSPSGPERWNKKHLFSHTKLLSWAYIQSSYLVFNLQKSLFAFSTFSRLLLSVSVCFKWHSFFCCCWYSCRFRTDNSFGKQLLRMAF